VMRNQNSRKVCRGALAALLSIGLAGTGEGGFWGGGETAVAKDFTRFYIYEV
jgi:hypothetical protein